MPHNESFARVCRTGGGLLYALSCASMFAVAASGLLSMFGILTSVNFLGPLADPVVILPILVFSIALTTFGMLRRSPLQIVLVTLGGALSYAGMSSMLGAQTMTGMSSDAVYIAWAGIALVASSFALSRMALIRPLSAMRTQTTGQTYGTRSEEKPIAPFILSLLAGLFIILGSLAANAFGMFGFMMMHLMGMSAMSTMHGGMDQMTGQMFMPGAFHTLFFSLGLLSGSLVFIGALMLYLRPSEHVTWGTIVLAFSIVSLVAAMGGFLVGLVLGMLGGILAITWKPAPTR